MQLSEKVDSLEKEVRLIRRIKPMNFFSTLEEIGLTPGTETIKDIVEHMPIPSTLTFQKLTNYGNNAIYPLASGSLTVVKRLSGRASLMFSGDYEDYRGFYNDVYAEPFVGWSKIESGITGSKTTDLNDAVEGLAYYSPSAPNTPSSGGSHYVQTFLPKQFNGEYGKQIAYRATGSGNSAALTTQTFIREKVANVWSPWRQLTNTFKGSGSPEGVVVASVGSFYFDTSSENNDVYYKTTETLNTGWKSLSSGSQGVGEWINIALGEGWSNGSPALRVRKEGDKYRLNGTVRRTVESAGAICTLPVGFRPANNIQVTVTTASGVFSCNILPSGGVFSTGVGMNLTFIDATFF